MDTDIHVRRLTANDNRASFRCGDIELDRFFQRYAGQNQFRHHIGTSYVAVLDQQITGFVTVSMGELTAENITRALRKRLPAYPLPVLRIARLAVDLDFQKQGIGKLLLKAMLELALKLRDQVGCTGVVVDAKTGNIEFYSRLGFSRIEVVTGMLGDRPEPAPMWLPIQLIAKAAQV
ncbi:MAG: GNAT family N-acetyltransferase [Thiogranum sp.]